MHVSKWGNSLAIRLPSAIVELLDLEEGDDIEVIVADDRTFAVKKKPTNKQLLARIRKFRGRLPADKAPFFDTNVLIYLLSSDEPKATLAEALLDQGGVISVQVLNELTNVARRKLALSWDEIREFVGVIRQLCVVGALTESTHTLGIQIAERYLLSVYDSMILAAALEANCKTVLSEDLQSGLVVNRQLTVKNPFSPDTR